MPMDIASFKVCRCDCTKAHNTKACVGFHHRFDRRRRPGTYQAEPCDREFHLDDGGSVTSESEICPRGAACDKCHNVVEVLYHEEVYKRRWCMDAEKEGGMGCPRGSFCAFAHSREELEERAAVYTSEEEQHPDADFFIYRYKTYWCPLPGVHDWDSCLYAHTKRDLRRSPLVGYSIKKCPHWEKSLQNEPTEGPPLPYSSCCPNGAACQMAHGIKEVLYHPSQYRVKPCTSRKCNGKKQRLCAFAHNDEQRRAATKETTPQNPCDILLGEQPQFFSPLVFATFRDNTGKSEATIEVPRTPSPRYDHVDVMRTPSPPYDHADMMQEPLCIPCVDPHANSCLMMPVPINSQQFVMADQDVAYSDPRSKVQMPDPVSPKHRSWADEEDPPAIDLSDTEDQSPMHKKAYVDQWEQATHCDGLSEISELGPSASVYLGPDAMQIEVTQEDTMVAMRHEIEQLKLAILEERQKGAQARKRLNTEIMKRDYTIEALTKEVQMSIAAASAGGNSEDVKDHLHDVVGSWGVLDSWAEMFGVK